MHGIPEGYVAMPVGGATTYPPQYQNVPVDANDFRWSPKSQTHLSAQAAAYVGAGVSQLPAGAEAAVAASNAGVMLGALIGRKTSFPLQAMSLLDPMSAAMEAGSAAFGATAGWGSSGYALAGRLAVGGAAGLGVGAAVAGGWEAAKYGARQTYTGFQQTAQAHRLTHGHQFFNGGGFMGRGYSPGETYRFSEQLRSLDLKDPFTSYGEMGRAVEGINAAGMTQGVRDADAATQIVRTQIRALQQLSRTLGTTLNEALPILRQMRMSGMYTLGEQVDNARTMRAAGALGVGSAAFMEMQAAGAQLTRDMQLGGAVGARLSAGTLMGIGTDLQSGRVSRAGLMDMTGASTIEEAQTAAASRVSNRVSSSIMGTSMGRALLLALGTQKGDRFTGSIDSNKLSEMLTDGTGLKNLTALSRGKIEGNAAAKASFYTQSENIAGSLLSANNGQDASALIGKLAMTEAGGDEDLAKIYLEQLGIRDRREADLILAAYTNYTARRRETARRLRQSEQADALRERYKIGVTKGVFGSLSNLAAAPFQALGGAMYHSVEHPIDALTDKWHGVSRFGMDDETSASLATQGSTTGFGTDFVNTQKRLSFGTGKYLHPGMISAGKTALDVAVPVGRILSAAIPGGLAPTSLMSDVVGDMIGTSSYRRAADGVVHSAESSGGYSAEQIALNDALLGRGGRISDESLRAAGATGVYANRRALEARIAGEGPGGDRFSGVLRRIAAGRETALVDDLSEVGAGIGSGDILRMGQATKNIVEGKVGGFLLSAGMRRLSDSGQANMAASIQARLGDGIGKKLVRDMYGLSMDASGFLSQEKAKENLHHAAIAAGIRKTDAATMELGGSTTGLFAALGRSGDRAEDITSMVNDTVARARASEDYQGVENQDEYINQVLATELSRKYNRTVSAEDARILRQTQSGKLGDLMRASTTAVNTSFIHSGATSARRNMLSVSDSGMLAQAAGGDLAAFRASVGTASGYATAFKDDGAADVLLEKLAKDPNTLRDILNSSRTSETERAIANAALQRSAGEGEDAAQLFRRYGISDPNEQKQFDAILQSGGTRGLNEALSRLAVQSQVGADSGGAQMIDSSMSMPMQIKKVADSVDLLNQSVRTTYNKVVRNQGTVSNWWNGEEEIQVNDNK